MVSALKLVTGLWRKRTKEVYKEITMEDVKCKSRENHKFYNKYSLKYLCMIRFEFQNDI